MSTDPGRTATGLSFRNADFGIITDADPPGLNTWLLANSTACSHGDRRAGDSHTTTYGAFGALGWYRDVFLKFEIHLLATQTLVYRKLKTTQRKCSGESYLRLFRGCSLNCLNVC
ncbi:hypothetical protein KCP75_00180 [Salmonella enterica subsp. enterica]|nr:hypothetical protein KCP75_00180 [Salmonella enterica subsp. enterica]